MPKLSEIPEKQRDKAKEKAIQSILEGKSQSAVAKEFGITRQAVSAWVIEYKRSGNKLPEKAKRGRPKQPKLTEEYEAFAREVIPHKKPSDFGLSNKGEDRWTCALFRDAVQDKFGTRVTPITIGRYLRKWGIGEPHINLPRPTYMPQYRMWDEEIKNFKENEKSADTEVDEQPKAEAKAAPPEREVEWENLGKIDYEAELKKMRDDGIKWETFYDESNPTGHGQKTGKHKKQRANQTKPKRKKKPKGNKRKKK